MSHTLSADSSLLLSNARVVLSQRVLEDVSLLIEDGRLSRLLGSVEVGDMYADAVYDLDGLTLWPGFIDVHIHGAVGVDTMEASVDDLLEVARFLAARGVTGWLPTLVPAPPEDYRRTTQAIDALMRAQESQPAAARALGLHYEGPFINSAQCGALRPPYFRVFDSSADLNDFATLTHERAAHLMTVAPEIEGGVELVRELRKRGWIVSIGHTRAGVEALDEACAAGARHMTHFFNAMSPLHHRAPGPVGWGLLRDDVTCDIIADGVHCDPLMLKLALRCKTAERLMLISDAVAPAGLGDGVCQIWGEQVSVANGRTSNARGQIAGSVITLHDAVRLMLSLNVSWPEVARMAALNPARLLGLADECGSIEEGKRADLVAIDEDGSVRLTLVGGRVAFDARQTADAGEA